jgi:PAS domain S-box-containing protein
MSGKAMLVWPPAGIALACILLFGYRFWPGVAVGAFLLSVISGNSLGYFSLATAIGSTLGAIVCTYLLDQFIKFHRSLDRVRDVAGFIGLACILGTTLNAMFNAVGIYYEGKGDWDKLFSTMLEWWIPNTMAGLIVAPFMLTWTSPCSFQWTRKLVISACLCGIGLIAGTLISFNSWYVYGIQNYPWAYLPYPFLVWSALQFKQRGATMATLIVSVLAIRSLLNNQGPFVAYTQLDSLMLLGSYLGILAITNMLLAALAAEQERAELALEHSEKRYRTIVEDQSDIICRFRSDGSLTFVNSAYCRFFGKTSEELLNTQFLPFISGQDREIPLSYFAALPKEHPIVSFDARVQSAKGEMTWQQCTIRRLMDDHENTVEFQAVVVDITRHKQAEETIRQVSERLQAILTSMVDGVIVIEADDTVGSFNPAAERIFGRASDQVINRSYRELFAEEDQNILTELYQKRFSKHNGNSIIELKALRPDSSCIPIDLAISEVSQGGERLCIMVVRDINERKQAEEQIREQATLLNKAQDAILVWDLDKKIQFWNKGAERLYGYSPEEVKNHDVRELLDGENEKFTQAEEGLFKRGDWIAEFSHKTKSGKKVIVKSRWSLVRDAQGVPKSILVINSDLTEQKELETMYLRAQRLESVGALASGIAHDLNNVLSPILLSAQLLRRNFPQEQNKNLLNNLEGSAMRGASIIKQLLTFGRGIEGKGAVAQPKYLLHEIGSIMRETFPKNIAVREKCVADIWLVSCDSTQLHQIILNLCINARDAMPHGGSITLSAANVELDDEALKAHTEAKKGLYVHFEVEDTGAGIPPEFREKIFEPFFSTKEDGKGTGLGLPTTLNIVRNHGGFLEMQSEVNKGTTFHVYLPATRVQTAQKETAISVEIPRGNNELIMVVEDEESVLQITQQILENHQYRVLGVKDGASATVLYSKRHDEIKLIIMDLVLPFMGGMKAIQTIQSYNPNIPIIIVSGVLTDPEAMKAQTGGFHAFLSKPYTSETLLTTIHQVLNR